MQRYILAIDQGTTSTRAILFDEKLNMFEMAQKEITNFYPHDGWVEHNANEIWLSVLACISEVITKSAINPKQVESIGITNQRETVVVWDKYTQLPVYNAIVWQSRQTEEICQKLIADGYNNFFKAKTGLFINPYFSATKIKWILDNVKGTKEKAKKGELLFGTIDTWLLYKLTGGKVHATDYSNASRTLLYNIYDLKWDQEILELLDISEKMLPEVKNSSGFFGKTASYHFFGNEVPITGIAGDQQASLFGHCCFAAGESKTTYGTGCFMLMNTKDKQVKSENGLLTTIAWGIDDKIDYALEGSIFVGGNAVKWLRDNLNFFLEAKDSERYAKAVKDTSNVYFVPAFVGLGAPYWNDYARGSIFGLTSATDKRHITRATLDSLAYQVKDLFYCMESDSKIKLKEVKVDGGASANNYLMQFQADILNVDIVREDLNETTALGVAMLSGLGSGLFKDKSDLKKLLKIERVFEPEMSEEERKKKYNGWKNAVNACIYYARK